MGMEHCDTMHKIIEFESKLGFMLCGRKNVASNLKIQ